MFLTLINLIKGWRGDLLEIDDAASTRNLIIKVTSKIPTRLNFRIINYIKLKYYFLRIVSGDRANFDDLRSDGCSTVFHVI